MKVEIKSHIITDDFFISPELYVPENKMEFSIGFSFDIGPIGEDSAEIFIVRVSNKCIQKNIIYSDKDIHFKKGCIEIGCYDYEQIMNAIKKYVNNINYNSWDEIEAELTKIFLGEFENYQEI